LVRRVREPDAPELTIRVTEESHARCRVVVRRRRRRNTMRRRPLLHRVRTQDHRSLRRRRQTQRNTEPREEITQAPYALFRRLLTSTDKNHAVRTALSKGLTNISRQRLPLFTVEDRGDGGVLVEAAHQERTFTRWNET